MTVNVDEMSEVLLSKLTSIANTIKEIEAEDADISGILMESYGLALRTIKAKADGQSNVIDLDGQIDLVSRALGVKLEDLIMKIVQQQFPPGNPTTLDPSNPQPMSIVEQIAKKADEATLNFITSASDLDDYEKFLAEAKAKESLDFLKKQI
jgi:hypothetical protein